MNNFETWPYAFYELQRVNEKGVKLIIIMHKFFFVFISLSLANFSNGRLFHFQEKIIKISVLFLKKESLEFYSYFEDVNFETYEPYI